METLTSPVQSPVVEAANHIVAAEAQVSAIEAQTQLPEVSTPIDPVAELTENAATGEVS
jgi:hypothetical protein